MPRPHNVIFELGLALMAYLERAIVLEIGGHRPTASWGLNVIRFDGAGPSIRRVIQ